MTSPEEEPTSLPTSGQHGGTVDPSMIGNMKRETGTGAEALDEPASEEENETPAEPAE